MDINALAIVAFAINIVTELTKEIKIVKKIPTRLYAIIVALVVSFVFAGASGTAFNLNMICSTIVSSFIAAYISVFGYDNFYLALKKSMIEQKTKSN